LSQGGREGGREEGKRIRGQRLFLFCFLLFSFFSAFLLPGLEGGREGEGDALCLGVFDVVVVDE